MNSAGDSRRLIWMLPALVALGWFAWASFQRPDSAVPGLQSSAVAESASVVEPDQPLQSAEFSSERQDAPRGRESVESGPTSELDETAKPRIWGTVEDAAGRPIVDGTVALVELDGQSKPKGRGHRALAWTNEQGAFELPLPDWVGTEEVLLVARAEGWQPYTNFVVLGPESFREPHTLTLGHGLEVVGQVVQDGLPVVGASVSIDFRYGTPGVFGVGAEGWWKDGRLENKHASTQTGQDGIFRMAGMGPGEYRLDLGLPESCPPSTVRHSHKIRAGEYQVYDVSSAYISLLVVDESGPVEGAQVHVTGFANRQSFKSEGEPKKVGVDVEGSMHLQVLSRGHSPKIIEDFRAPGIGETRDCVIEIKRLQRPSMTVELPGAQRAGVNWIFLTLHRGDLGSQGAGPSQEALHLERGEGGDLFHAPVVDLESGSYLLVMRASSKGGASACVGTRAQPIELPPVGHLGVPFELDLWAQFSMDFGFDEFEGRSVTIRRRILNSSGTVLVERETYRESEPDPEFPGEFMFMESEESSGNRRSQFGWRFNGAWDRSGQAPDRRWGLLPAGSYTLEVSVTGHQLARKTITLVAGQKNDLSIRLKPKPGK
ncbi:MAG: carboxypeptidase-like regulatory domain-containing protein [Planctomycetota bacterium]|nr:carboxypeptidase-like regulatory domain-containing protein [Planctomycetota bacterium]